MSVHGGSTKALSQKMVPFKNRTNDYSDTAQSRFNSRNHNNDNNTMLTNLDDGSLDACGCESSVKKTPENYPIILREHETKHHGHVHSPPKSLSAVAWMLLTDDGLHVSNVKFHQFTSTLSI